jgi:hypothetical protein
VICEPIVLGDAVDQRSPLLQNRFLFCHSAAHTVFPGANTSAGLKPSRLGW